MINAHIRDAYACIDFFSYMEDQVSKFRTNSVASIIAFSLLFYIEDKRCAQRNVNCKNNQHGIQYVFSRLRPRERRMPGPR